MDYQFFQKLLREGEKANVDFKIDAQVFANGLVADRGELAKDICALANNGNVKSYIVVGVSDDRKHFKNFANAKLTDDALQDFCKAAVYPPPRVRFSIGRWEKAQPQHAHKNFGVIEVGPHARTAFRLARDFIDYPNKVCFKKNEVWIRRGATSDQATPEEVVGLLRKSPETRSTSDDNVIYQRLPVDEQSGSVREHLATVADDVGASLEGVRLRITLAERQYVWRVHVVPELSTKEVLYEILQYRWDYEHGILVVSLGSVGKSSLPPVVELASKETWGYYIRVSLARKYYGHLAQLERGIRHIDPISLPIVVLGNVRDSQTLRAKFLEALAFLNEHPGELSELAISRRIQNANLRRLLLNGWRTNAGTYYGPDTDKLKKGDIVEGGDFYPQNVYRAEWDPEDVEVAREILSLSGASLPKLPRAAYRRKRK